MVQTLKYVSASWSCNDSFNVNISTFFICCWSIYHTHRSCLVQQSLYLAKFTLVSVINLAETVVRQRRKLADSNTCMHGHQGDRIENRISTECMTSCSRAQVRIERTSIRISRTLNHICGRSMAVELMMMESFVDFLTELFYSVVWLISLRWISPHQLETHLKACFMAVTRPKGRHSKYFLYTSKCFISNFFSSFFFVHT